MRKATIVFVVGIAASTWCATPLSAQSKSPKRGLLTALNYIVRAEALDTVMAWTMIDSASVRIAAKLTAREFGAFARMQSARTVIRPAISDSTCPQEAAFRCVAIRFENITVRRKQYIVAVEVWNPRKGACGGRVSEYRIALVGGEAALIERQQLFVGNCAARR